MTVKSSTSSGLTETEIWDKYQTELREIYSAKSLVKPIYPLFHLVKEFYIKKPYSQKTVVAEVGFGDGSLLKSLSEFFDAVWGLDISPKNLQLTSEKFSAQNISNVHFDLYDIFGEPKFQGQFDAMVLSHVLEHFDSNDIKKVLDNIRFSLNENGLLFGATPYRKPLQKRLCPNCAHVFEIDGHKLVLDDDSILNILENNGFTVLKVRHFNPTHYYWGKNKFYKLFHTLYRKLFNVDLATQLEFIAQVKS